MKNIWNCINNKDWKIENKYGLFLFITTSISSVIGFVIWFALHFFILNKISWAICFTGYPGFFIGLIGGIIYLYHFVV